MQRERIAASVDGGYDGPKNSPANSVHSDKVFIVNSAKLGKPCTDYFYNRVTYYGLTNQEK